MNELNYTVRSATIDDCQEIASVHVKAWQESYAGIVSPQYLKNISFDERLKLREKILTENNPDCIHLVAVVDNTIIGFCDAGPSFIASEQYRGEIYAIYLLEKYKNLGIGSKLIKSAHAHLVQQNLVPYITSVLKKNESARKFYKKNGGHLFNEEIVDIGDECYPESVYIFEQ